MAFSSPMDSNPAMSGQSPQSIARNSPQVARIISPPVADTTWPQQGQVLAGSTRRRRHSLPQPVVPDVPQENAGSSKPNLSHHMDLDSTMLKLNPICVNPPQHSPVSRQHTVSSINVTMNTSSTQSRTLNGINMDLDFDPPASQQMNFGSGGGGNFEQGIPFTRPPQLTLHSPTNDGKSKASTLGKAHLSSLASRKTARQHHFHERRAPQIHRIQLGKRHMADREEDEDDDGYYTSSGPACKQFINEERMAARMNSLNISGGNQTQGNVFSSFWQAAPAHNSQRFEWQNPRKLPTFDELESRLSDSDPSEDEGELRIEYAPELRKVLRKRDGLLPEHIARQLNPNCMQLVLWEPPAAITEEKIKDNSPPSNPNPSPAEASMDCISEPLNVTPPGGGGFTRIFASRGNRGRNNISPEQRNTSPGADWGANVQLFDSVDDDDMDL